MKNRLARLLLDRTWDGLDLAVQEPGTAIDEYKHYVTNQSHPEHYGLYPKAGKYSGWQ